MRAVDCVVKTYVIQLFYLWLSDSCRTGVKKEMIFGGFLCFVYSWIIKIYLSWFDLIFYIFYVWFVPRWPSVADETFKSKKYHKIICKINLNTTKYTQVLVIGFLTIKSTTQGHLWTSKHRYGTDSRAAWPYGSRGPFEPRAVWGRTILPKLTGMKQGYVWSTYLISARNT